MNAKEIQKVINRLGEIILSIDYNNKDFPHIIVGEKVDVQAKLFWFNYNISSEEVMVEMDCDGYRPAALIELLVLWFIQNHDLQELRKQLWILALGSSGWFADDCFWVLKPEGLSSTCVGLSNHWSNNHCFLGIHK